MNKINNINYITIKINYYISKIFGLLPYNIEINQECVDNTIKYSVKFFYTKLSSFYNIILIILISCLSFTSTSAAYYMEYTNKSEVTSMIIFFKAVIGTSVLIILWINIWNKKYDAINCGNKFINITNGILKLHHLYLNNSIKYRIAGVTIINISIWICLLTCDGIMFPNFLGFSAISLALPNFICSWFLLQYAFALMLIKKQFNNLNCSILKLSTRKLTLNYFRESISSQIPLSNQLILDLFTIRKNYKLMCEIVREIRFMFSFSILIIIVLFNINIISTTYYFIQPLFQPEIPWSFFVTFDTLTYLAMELFPIIIMTTSVTQLMNEVSD